MPLIDLHTHSDASDGTDTPAQLVMKAAESGLDVLGLADHDTFEGIAAARTAGRRAVVRVIAAVEVSCEVGGLSVHLLGFGPRTDDPALTAELARIRDGRQDRIPGMLAKLAALGYPVTMDEVAAQVGVSPSVGRPHVADALVARGYLADRQEAFDTLIGDGGPAYVDRYACELGRGIALLRAAGAVTVIAHPWGRGSRPALTPEALAEFAAQGLDGLEVDHTDHDSVARAELRELAASLGLLVTGGSDHHGLGKRDNPLAVHTTAPKVFAEIGERVAVRGGHL